jgi:hypothetical protein
MIASNCPCRSALAAAEREKNFERDAPASRDAGVLTPSMWLGLMTANSGEILESDMHVERRCLNVEKLRRTR